MLDFDESDDAGLKISNNPLDKFFSSHLGKVMCLVAMAPFMLHFLGGGGHHGPTPIWVSNDNQVNKYELLTRRQAEAVGRLQSSIQIESLTERQIDDGLSEGLILRFGALDDWKLALTAGHKTSSDIVLKVQAINALHEQTKATAEKLRRGLAQRAMADAGAEVAE